MFLLLRDKWQPEGDSTFLITYQVFALSSRHITSWWMMLLVSYVNSHSKHMWIHSRQSKEIMPAINLCIAEKCETRCWWIHHQMRHNMHHKLTNCKCYAEKVASNQCGKKGKYIYEQDHKSFCQPGIDVNVTFDATIAILTTCNCFENTVFTQWNTKLFWNSFCTAHAVRMGLAKTSQNPHQKA